MKTAIADVSVHRARVSPKTEWIFVRLAAADGIVGWGEATLNGQETAVIEAVQRLGAALREGASPYPGRMRAEPDDALPAWAAASAIDMALSDIAARREGRPLAAMLGPEQHNPILVYANINRRTVDRTPAGFAASAAAATAAGHSLIKIAPFDGLTPALCGTAEGDALIAAGLSRIEAARAAGPSGTVLVDCHWRFAPAAVPALVDALAPLRVTWLECPIPEDADAPTRLKQLRRQTQRHGMLLAGCEHQTTAARFEPFLRAGAYDVIMPDVKYVGTLDAMLEIAARAKRLAVQCAPHNPSGPIAHAASLHVCAAMDYLFMLETQFDETPHFAALVGGALPPCDGGAIAVPNGPGLGVAIDPDALARLVPDLAGP